MTRRGFLGAVLAAPLAFVLPKPTPFDFASVDAILKAEYLPFIADELNAKPWGLLEVFDDGTYRNDYLGISRT